MDRKEIIGTVKFLAGLLFFAGIFAAIVTTQPLSMTLPLIFVVSVAVANPVMNFFGIGLSPGQRIIREKRGLLPISRFRVFAGGVAAGFFAAIVAVTCVPWVWHTITAEAINEAALSIKGNALLAVVVAALTLVIMALAATALIASGLAAEVLKALIAKIRRRRDG